MPYHRFRCQECNEYQERWHGAKFCIKENCNGCLRRSRPKSQTGLVAEDLAEHCTEVIEREFGGKSRRTCVDSVISGLTKYREGL